MEFMPSANLTNESRPLGGPSLERPAGARPPSCIYGSGRRQAPMPWLSSPGQEWREIRTWSRQRRLLPSQPEGLVTHMRPCMSHHVSVCLTCGCVIGAVFQ